MRMDLKDKEEPTYKNKTFTSAFEFALQGIKTVYQEERNMRFHFIFAILSVILGLFFKLNRGEWLWLLTVIFLMFVMETINTAFENMVDLATKKHFDPIGKKVKDMAAGAVLLTSIFAILVGLLLFVPKVWEALQAWLQ